MPAVDGCAVIPLNEGLLSKEQQRRETYGVKFKDLLPSMKGCSRKSSNPRSYLNR